MKNTEKSSSNNNNNNTLSVETIKAQLKAACKGMNAKETKEYIKTLDGYSLRLTGEKPTQHYTIFYGEVRVCNVEQVQGIKTDGTARGGISVAKVNFQDAAIKVYENKYKKLYDEFTEDEKMILLELEKKLLSAIEKIQDVFDSCNNRISEAAKEAAKKTRTMKRAANIKTDNLDDDDFEALIEQMRANRKAAKQTA